MCPLISARNDNNTTRKVQGNLSLPLHFERILGVTYVKKDKSERQKKKKKKKKRIWINVQVVVVVESTRHTTCRLDSVCPRRTQEISVDSWQKGKKKAQSFKHTHGEMDK